MLKLFLRLYVFLMLPATAAFVGFMYLTDQVMAQVHAETQRKRAGTAFDRAERIIDLINSHADDGMTVEEMGRVQSDSAPLRARDIVLRLDVHLGALIRDYGAWVYAILFAVIFAETGLVVTPFLPGDSLLFVAGALAALGGLDVHILVALLVAAAILGNTTNYAIGRWLEL